MYQALDIMDSGNQVLYYGWFNFHPSWLNVFISIKWALFFISMGAMIQGVAVNGLLHYFIPMIERHFELTSTKVGLMSGAYDVACLICLIPVTYYGGLKNSSKPIYIGTGLFIMGTGSFIFALPAFLTGPYSRFYLTTLCVDHVIPTEQVKTTHNIFEYILLLTGNFLHGVGASPLYTLGITYLHENSPPNKSSIYLGIFYLMAIVGPSLGYLIGGYLANLYVDFPFKTQYRTIDITPENPNWVGCWWLGFLCCAVASLIFCAPVLGLPKNLKENQGDESTDRRLVVSSYGFSRLTPITGGLPNAIYRVIRRLKFDFITCAGFCEGIVISGMGSFFPKILEQQFGASSQATSIMLGGFGIPCAMFGVMTGGWVVRHFRLKLNHTLLFCVVMVCCAVISSTGLFLHCPTYIGSLHEPHPKQTAWQQALIRDCNRNCHCEPYAYDPICGIDGKNYFSPCFAGCVSSTIVDKIRYYYDCKCIKTNGTRRYDAKHYACPVKCHVFYLFASLLCIYQVFTFAACIPALTATLRSVEDEFKSLGVGIQWMLVRMLGTIPGPVVFGMIFDKTCIAWYRHSPDDDGICLLYDHGNLSIYLGGIVILFKSLEAMFFIIAYCIKADTYDEFQFEENG